MGVKDKKLSTMTHLRVGENVGAAVGAVGALDGERLGAPAVHVCNIFM